MSYFIYFLIFILAGITWSRVLESVIITELNINGFETSFERGLHVFLWPISLGIFLYRYFQVLLSGKADD